MHQLEYLIREKDRVFALHEIPKGSFVCEYVAEVISDSKTNH